MLKPSCQGLMKYQALLLGSRDLAVEVFLRMAGCGNPLKVTLLAAGFAPKNRGRKLGPARTPAYHTQYEAESACYKTRAC